MTNLEFYKDEILKFANMGLAIGVENGIPVACSPKSCKTCDFCKQFGNCGATRAKWFLAEYEPYKPKLTKEERKFLEYLKDIYPRLDGIRKCIAASESLEIYPVIELVFCMDESARYPILIPIGLLNSNIRFDFLRKWDMVTVEELLKLEVEE